MFYLAHSGMNTIQDKMLFVLHISLLALTIIFMVYFTFLNFQDAIPTQKRRIEDEEWFHGVLPREEVQRLLTEDGDYLVRESKNRKTNETQYVLSVFWQGHKHFIIQGSEVSHNPLSKYPLSLCVCVCMYAH